MPLSSVYYIAELDGGERFIITDSAESLRANIRNADEAIRVRRPRGQWLMVREPLSFNPGEYQFKRSCKIIRFAEAYGRKQRNNRTIL